MSAKCKTVQRKPHLTVSYSHNFSIIRKYLLNLCCLTLLVHLVNIIEEIEYEDWSVDWLRYVIILAGQLKDYQIWDCIRRTHVDLLHTVWTSQQCAADWLGYCDCVRQFTKPTEHRSVISEIAKQHPSVISHHFARIYLNIGSQGRKPLICR